MLLHKFNSKRIIKGYIEAINPIHIGSSNTTLDPTQVETAVLTNVAGKPLIPGSSLKGVLRSTMESYQSAGIFEGIMKNNKSKRDCFITDVNSICINNDKYKKFKEESIEDNKTNYKELAKKIYDNSCIVCRLFGNGFMSARLHIMDMEALDDNIKMEIRDGVAIDRETGTGMPGHKYSYSAIPAGTKFNFNLIAENLSDEENKILDIIIKIMTEGDLSLGGFTSRGLGKVKLVVEDDKAESVKDLLKKYSTIV